MKQMKLKKILPLIPLLLSMPSNANSLEVLHWWTAPGEFEAQNVLKQALAKQGISWQNFAIVGSGGDSAMRVLQMRALSGNPPDAAQIKGPDIAEWSKIGMLKEVDNILNNELWNKNIPDVVKQTITYQGHYMALPLNIHRVNWLWLNKAIFEQLKLSPPTTWNEFFSIADKIQAAGYIALSHGGTSWEDSLLFESVALSILGAEKYKRAFVEFDETILTSSDMIVAFKLFKRLHQYVDKSMVGKNWEIASQMLTDKKAGMLFMGDWAKGLWHAAGKVANEDYLCVDVPESKNLFSYNIDSFVFFKKQHQNGDNLNTEILANTLLSEQLQHDFNIDKGSIPVRTDIDISDFDACSHKSFSDFKQSALVPSFSQNIATSSFLQSEMRKVISTYFKSDNLSAEQVTKQLALAIRAVNKK